MNKGSSDSESQDEKFMQTDHFKQASKRLLIDWKPTKQIELVLLSGLLAPIEDSHTMNGNSSLDFSSNRRLGMTDPFTMIKK